MKSISLAHHTCPLQATGLKSRQQPGFSDPICSSYRTKLQLNDAIRKYLKLGIRESRIAVIGQRKDIERVARFTSDPQQAGIAFDTWIPLNTYSSLPGKSINRKLEGFFTACRDEQKQPVLFMEATELVSRWNLETSMGAVMFEWVEWARNQGIPMLVLFHHSGIEHLPAISLLQPFSWAVIKGKFWNNPYHVPQCPVLKDQPRHCDKVVLSNIQRLIKSGPTDQNMLNKITRLIHYYLGPRRVKEVIARLDLDKDLYQFGNQIQESIDRFPLDIPDHPNATITVVWNKNVRKYPNDFHLVNEAIDVLSNSYKSWLQKKRTSRLQHIVNNVVHSARCHVIGMEKDGTLEVITGESSLSEFGEDIIEYFPETWVRQIYETLLIGNAIASQELTLQPAEDLEPITFRVDVQPIKDDPLEDLLGLITLREVTEEKKLQSDLMQVQKQDTLRVMSGGITHDLNNVLSAVMGYASYLSMRISPEDPLREDLAMIEKSTGRAADLVRRLLGYARRPRKPTGLVDSNAISREVARLLEPSLNGSYNIQLELSADVWPILGDANQIQQAIMNLCLNAKSAMSYGGTIILKTENIYITGKEPGFKSLKPGLYSAIMVSDKGTGIPRDIRKKIFEPFFTTKPPGKGTGLGLTMVRMITTNHGGRLMLRSQKNKGTTISLFLPAVADVQETTEHIQGALKRGREGVLVVDDEPSVLDMGARILRDHGYRVFTASSINEAEEILLKHLNNIDLALMDVFFPQNNILQCSQTLKELSPNLKVVLFSGYPQENNPLPASEMSQFPFVQKPFHARDLLETVRQTLDGEQ
ncbi:hypothetical protein AMJ86_09520 [bacterium SM23_57]|nr:MAG: hypothetical protein AMJ86_09520 [bacterium SM23_57]